MESVIWIRTTFLHLSSVSLKYDALLLYSLYFDDIAVY